MLISRSWEKMLRFLRRRVHICLQRLDSYDKILYSAGYCSQFRNSGYFKALRCPAPKAPTCIDFVHIWPVHGLDPWPTHLHAYKHAWFQLKRFYDGLLTVGHTWLFRAGTRCTDSRILTQGSCSQYPATFYSIFTYIHCTVHPAGTCLFQDPRKACFSTLLH